MAKKHGIIKRAINELGAGPVSQRQKDKAVADELKRREQAAATKKRLEQEAADARAARAAARQGPST